jgi:hypothetical protein
MTTYHPSYTGVKTVLGFGPKSGGSVLAQPDGLLVHEKSFFFLVALFDIWASHYIRQSHCRTGIAQSTGPKISCRAQLMADV